MSEHKATTSWKRTTTDFQYETYDRTHTIRFEGGKEITASSAPEFMGKKEFANPEEQLAAALSSCHLLTFLAVAAKSRITVESYEDTATAILDKGPSGKMSVTKTILRPKVTFSKDTPVDAEKYKSLHEKAHANCFIGNSLNSAFEIYPEMR